MARGPIPQRVLILLFVLTVMLMSYFLNSRHILSSFMEAEYAPFTSKKGVHNPNTDPKSKPVHFMIFDASRHRGSLKFLDNLSNKWTVLLVNSERTSQLESCQKCRMVDQSWSRVFLTREMASKTWKQMPSYARQKAVAVLYALWNSAQWLYVTDSKVLLDEDTLLSVCSHQSRTAPVYRGPNQIFEPCEHFMDPYTWHGLNATGIPQGSYSIRAVATDAVYMVVNGCYRKHMDAVLWKRGFNMQAPRPHLMAGTFSSVDFHNVIVSRKMAWTLLASLPRRFYGSGSLDRQRVLLNLMIQRAIWETNGTVGFLPTSRFPNTPECPSCNINTSLKKFGEIQLKNITNWRCNPTNNLIECLEQFDKYFSPQLISSWKSDNSELQVLLKAWLNLFSSYRLTIATREPLTADRLTEKHKGVPLQFTPAKSMHVLPDKSSLPRNVFADLCKTQDGKKYPLYIPKDYPIPDILLVVVFNWGKPMEHIPKLEYVYGRHFKHILYCGEDMAGFRRFYAGKNPRHPVSFIQIATGRGYRGYGCMGAAIKMGYQVSGYLQMGDDVILNVGKVRALPPLQPWFQRSIRYIHIDQEMIYDRPNHGAWNPWRGARNGVLNVYKRLLELQSAPQIGERVSDFLETLRNVTKCDRCLTHDTADIFYVPANMSADFNLFADIFYERQVFLEVTIPTILIGLARDTGIYRMTGFYVWGGRRDKIHEIYTKDHHFLHPLKFSKLSDLRKANFLCRRVIDPADEDLKKYDGVKRRQ